MVTCNGCGRTFEVLWKCDSCGYVFCDSCKLDDNWGSPAQCPRCKTYTYSDTK